MRRSLVCLCVCALSIASADARMYQWTSPDTGSTQLSGRPPAWYRSAQGGPRVYVFDDNRLVDDTGITVSAEQRAALRAEAFGEAPPVAQPSASAAAHAATSDERPAPPSAAPAAAVDQDPAAKAAALKSLIDAWDQKQLDQARSLLDLLPPANTAPAAPR